MRSWTVFVASRWALGAVALVAACTEANPTYEPPATGPDGAPPECQAGERRCLDQVTQACSGGGRWVNERLCPGLSTCEDGVCVPSGPPCGSEADCGPGLACAVFVNPAAPDRLATFCARTVGFKPGLYPCTGDEQCRSGLCLQRGGQSFCFQACGEDTDCPKASHRCVQVSVTVGGVHGQVGACSD